MGASVAVDRSVAARWRGALQAIVVILTEAFAYASKAAAQTAGWGSSGTESGNNTSWTITAGALVVTRGGGTNAGSPKYSIAGLTPGRAYRLTADVSGALPTARGTNGSGTFSDTFGLNATFGSTGLARTLDFTATQSSGILAFTVSTLNSSSTIDNLDIRSL